MISKLIVFLFWPWVNATVCSAYNEFQLSREFNYMCANDLKKANQHFHNDAIERYMKLAIIKHWKRILFLPWTIVCSNERHIR